MEWKNIEDCFRARVLRKISPDKEKSVRSMELAKKNLKKVSLLIEEDKELFFEIVVINSYMAMFHAARAVLYLDGIQEKNHYAVFLYLKEKYKAIVPVNILNLLNIHRAERHEAMYGLEYNPDREDAKTSIDDAKVFVGEMKKLLKEKR
jgi:uncharacterized protein (UPF0332 family)